MRGRPTIANAITASRVVCAVLLVVVPAFSVGFFALYLWCGVSDALDGWLARRWGCSNALGARFDSVADAVFVFCVAIALVPALSWKPWMVAWMCVVAAVRVVSYAVGCWKYHTFSALHTRLNKLTGIVLFCVPILYLFIGMNAIVVIACAVATVSAVEELAIMLTSTELNRDIARLGAK